MELSLRKFGFEWWSKQNLHLLCTLWGSNASFHPRNETASVIKNCRFVRTTVQEMILLGVDISLWFFLNFFFEKIDCWTMALAKLRFLAYGSNETARASKNGNFSKTILQKSTLRSLGASGNILEHSRGILECLWADFGESSTQNVRFWGPEVKISDGDVWGCLGIFGDALEFRHG